MGEACGTYVRQERCIQGSGGGHVRERDHLEVLGVNGGTLLEWVKAVEHAMNVQVEIGGSCTLPLTSALDVGGWSTSRPGRFTPGKDPVPIVQEI